MGADYYQFAIAANVPVVWETMDSDPEGAALWADLTGRIKGLLAEEKYQPLGVDIVTDVRTYEE